MTKTLSSVFSDGFSDSRLMINRHFIYYSILATSQLHPPISRTFPKEDTLQL